MNLTTLYERRLRNILKGKYTHPGMTTKQMKAIENTKAFVWEVIVRGGMNYSQTPRACRQLVDMLAVRFSNEVVQDIGEETRQDYLGEGPDGAIGNCLVAVVGINIAEKLTKLGFPEQDVETMIAYDEQRSFPVEPTDLIRA